MFAGIYYWFPKATGRQLNETLGKIHFWGSLIFINGVFAPMFLQGLMGVSRRLYDGGAQYAHVKDVLYLNVTMSMAAWTLAFFQLFFIINFFMSLKTGKRAEANPWQATTLDFAATTSPPLAHGNFATVPRVYRDPYEYSVPGAAADFTPQNAERA
jgi:cytochrome c oxidase subunit 1